MNHATPCSHPLHAAVFDQPFVAGTVAMTHAAFDHESDGLEASVRMIGKPGKVIVGVVAVKGIKHQEGIKAALQRLAQYPVEFDPGPIGGRLTGDQTLDSARQGQAVARGSRVGQSS
jgi:hypothetical protein